MAFNYVPTHSIIDVFKVVVAYDCENSSTHAQVVARKS